MDGWFDPRHAPREAVPIPKEESHTDQDGKRGEPKIIAEKLVQPNGVAFHGGSLYVAAIDKVYRYDGIERVLDKVPEPADMSKAFGLPPEVHHNWKFLAVGPDNKLYVPVGAPCNVCEINTGVHGQIRRYNLDGQRAPAAGERGQWRTDPLWL